jgi:hypothetical protein
MKREHLVAIIASGIFWATVLGGNAQVAPNAPDTSTRIGNFYFATASGIAFIKDDAAAFIMDPSMNGPMPSASAPDLSFHKTLFYGMEMDWGRVGNAVVGRLTSDHAGTITFKLLSGWPGFSSQFSPIPGGVKGVATVAGGKTITWQAQSSPSPVSADDKQFTVAVAPNAPAHFVAGFGILPGFDGIDDTLSKAEQAYEARRPKAEGPAGDFLGAIADNLNNSRIYSNDNHMVAISVSRGWAKGPNGNPYFCWDSFFNGALACLDDPVAARQTVRAILSCQTPEGLVPNFGHWSFGNDSASNDRSQPPVGSMCVWKMHLLQPDLAFLKEVYPKLAKWHDWWMVARNAKHDGLLEWGSSTNDMQGAKWETGWDDTVQFEGAKMVGSTMNAYAVDLNSLWAMDAHYLALIANAIGQPNDAVKYQQEQKEMNQRINDKLWNESLGIYCSRMWDGDDGKPGAFLTRLTPMNFYPLICGAPDTARAARVLAVMTDPKQFWGDWILPTVSRTDPVFPQQGYWHGTVWAPVNYLVFQGVKKYAPPPLRAEYAEKSVKLFMQNWQSKGICSENYLSTTGEPHSDPHYTWGALLCLIGFESIVDFDDSGRVRTGAGINQDVTLDNIPWGGRLHQVTVQNEKISILEKR